MRTLFLNIKEIFQIDKGHDNQLVKGAHMSDLKTIRNAFLIVNNGTIENYGKMEDLIANQSFDKTYDASGQYLFPSFCDSHTHLVYPAPREGEFFDRLKGLTYLEIAQKGGGILNSANLLHSTSEEELYNSAKERVEEIAQKGTGAVEIKSGYGLNLEDELKILRVIRRLSESTPLEIKATLMAAHAIPKRFNGDSAAYTDEIINEIIPVVASEGLADFVDVFCEEGFFTVTDTDRILNSGMKYGFRAKVHANQMNFSGGVELAVKYNAISADHLEHLDAREIELLKNSDTIPVLLPGSTEFLQMKYAPGRAMIDTGLPISIASNYNPGSSPWGDMRYMLYLASLHYKMNFNELLNASTINGALAMDLGESFGSITRGKRANFYLTKPISSPEFIVYAFLTPIIDKIFLNGEQL